MKTRKKRLIVTVITAIAVPLLILACTTPEPEPPVDADPPVIHSLQAEWETVFPSESIQIVCNASAPDGAVLSYEWWASGGEIDGQGATVTWTAPDSEGVYNITVTVTDGRGGEVTDDVTITVQANRPPIINSLAVDADWAFPTSSLLVTCDAEDPDGHPLSYEWSASAGHFDGTGPEVTWIAPEEVGTYNITVVVSDGYGGSATAILPLRVMPEQPPAIEALIVTADHKYLTVYPTRYKVGRAQEYHIECIVSDTGVELLYEWSSTGGEISGEGSLITWTAPDQTVTVSVTVVVSDIVGRSATKSVDLDVVPCSEFG